ncbi:ABC transporter ATP-binding protein [Bacteroides sp. UBA939]|uniref:ABC transporter ATP-binding protein n=1 Tax=Bacteroides sp. UBA939 TaxID=1946092 RepID=UPI0025C28234|nr:ATP-binding cassette domain-containing protein [Bacteroides sp. UBA939]
MLQIDNACIAFGEDTLFSGFNMQLYEGEIACISGQSGKGKTSLLNAILGFVPLRMGDIIVNGVRLEKPTIDLIRRQVAWIPQELVLPSEWVREMVQLPFNLKANRATPFSMEKLLDCFEELGLEKDLYDKRVNEVSGGQRQRIMIAVAIMMQKPLLVVDEPTSALDSNSTEKVLAFFRKQMKKGSAVLAVSHDLRFAQGCNQMITL